MKKILMVGVLDVVGSTNIAMKKGFEALGYVVDEYNYRTIMEQRGMKGMWNHFEHEFLAGRSYDLIVFCKTNQIPPQLLDKAKEVAPTWYWFMDSIEVAKAIYASAYAQNATFASATASDVADRFKAVNKNAHHVFEGYDPDVYFHEDLKKIHDVLFIGNATIPRIIQISNLQKEGINVSIFGKGWPFEMKPNPPVFGEDERIEINQSKIVLNLCHDDVIFSDRVIKALGCGAVVVSQPCKDLLSSELGTFTYSYTSVDHFKNIITNINILNPCGGVATQIADCYSWKAVCRWMMGEVREYCGR